MREMLYLERSSGVPKNLDVAWTFYVGVVLVSDGDDSGFLYFRAVLGK